MLTRYFKKTVIFLSEYLRGFIIFVQDPYLCLTIHKILLDAINLANNPKNVNKVNSLCYKWFIAPLKTIQRLNY